MRLFLLLKKIFFGCLVSLASLIFACLLIELTMRYVWTDWKDKWDQTRKFHYKVTPQPYHFRMGHWEYFRKDPNVFRIIALGDSYTFGEGVADAENVYTRILEKLLNARYNAKYPGIRIEVINMGVGGFTTVNELELLTDLGSRFQPDMVMVQFLQNDTEISGKDFAHLSTVEQFKVRMNLVSNKAVHDWLEAHSYFYAFLNEKSRMLQYKIKIPPEFGFDDDYVGWQQCQYALECMTGFCLQNGLDRPVMVAFPFFIAGKWTERDFPQKKAHEKIRDAAVKSGFYFLDLLPVYLNTGRDLRSFWGKPLDHHPNEEANYIAAVVIDEFIFQLGILEPRLKDFQKRSR